MALFVYGLITLSILMVGVEMGIEKRYKSVKALEVKTKWQLVRKKVAIGTVNIFYIGLIGVVTLFCLWTCGKMVLSDSSIYSKLCVVALHTVGLGAFFYGLNILIYLNKKRLEEGVKYFSNLMSQTMGVTEVVGNTESNKG